MAEGYTAATVGGGCSSNGLSCRTHPASIQFREALLTGTYPNSVVAHEYGHVWSNYDRYSVRHGSWDPYLEARACWRMREWGAARFGRRASS